MSIYFKPFQNEKFIDNTFLILYNIFKDFQFLVINKCNLQKGGYYEKDCTTGFGENL